MGLGKPVAKDAIGRILTGCATLLLIAGILAMSPQTSLASGRDPGSLTG